MDLRAEPTALPGRPELHFPYLGGKPTHLHLAWANPGRSVQGTAVSSQSPPVSPASPDPRGVQPFLRG